MAWMRAKTTSAGSAPAWWAALTVVLVLGTAWAAPAGATEAEGESDGEPAAEESVDGLSDAEAEQLREGAAVYSQICSSCHQPGGAGLPGQYPPLLDNPRVDDADYVAGVIENGLDGPIEVNGETYDGVMPSFSTLEDDEVDAVIAYLQNDLEAPGGEAAIQAPTGPVAGTELPGFTDAGALVAYLLAALVGAMVLYPRLVSVNDRLAVPWLDVGLKTATIVVAVALFTVYLPDLVLETNVVASADRVVQDLVGSGAWAIGLGVVLGGLWWAHKESRI